MRKILGVGMLVVLVAGAIVTQSVLASPDSVRTPETLRFRTKAVKVHYDGTHAGDTFTIHSRLMKHGKRVGSEAVFGAITYRTGPGTGENIFTTVARLPKGEIVSTGKFFFVPQPQNFKAAITGGTGHYKNARGFVEAVQKKHASIVTYHVIP